MKASMITVSGNVQAVGFRYAARAKARDLDIAGWISNATDGSVRAFVQGDDNAVDRFTEWMRSGPAGATVSGFDVTEDAVDDGLTGFEAR